MQNSYLWTLRIIGRGLIAIPKDDLNMFWFVMIIEKFFRPQAWLITNGVHDKN